MILYGSTSPKRHGTDSSLGLVWLVVVGGRVGDCVIDLSGRRAPLCGWRSLLPNNRDPAGVGSSMHLFRNEEVINKTVRVPGTCTGVQVLREHGSTAAMAYYSSSSSIFCILE
jgi:hypothetical protein